MSKTRDIALAGLGAVVGGAAVFIYDRYGSGLEKENMLGWRIAIEYAGMTKDNVVHPIVESQMADIVNWISQNSVSACKAEWTRLVTERGLQTYIKLPW